MTHQNNSNLSAERTLANLQALDAAYFAALVLVETYDSGQLHAGIPHALLIEHAATSGGLDPAALEREIAGLLASGDIDASEADRLRALGQGDA